MASTFSIKHSIFVLAAVAAVATTASARAEVGAAVTAGVGTTGAGLHLVVPMEADLNGRFGANYFQHDFDKRSGSLNYKMDGKLQTVDVLFDWYVVPQSAFRLTGGILYNGNRVNAEARPNADGRYSINGRSYSAADVGTLRGDLTFRRAAPYIGIGWGNPLTPNKRWNFNADLGAFYQGKAQVNLISRGCVTSNIVCGILAADVNVEEQRLADEASDYKVYPVLRASVSYSF